MEYENLERGTPMKTRCLDLDIISTLPQSIIETILTLMPIQYAIKTSILSKKWRYSWRTMPKLVFTKEMVKLPPNSCRLLKKYKLVSSIFHVLLLHNGPKILEFNFYVGALQMDSEFDQIFSYLARVNNLKELIFINHKGFYRLPVSFFSLQGLETIQLQNCVIEPLSTFNGFSQLKSIITSNVKISAQMPLWFLSKCPLLEYISLVGDEQSLDFIAGGNKFTFVDLLRCVPLIQTLDISNCYMKYLSSGGMPQKLPTSLVHLEYFYLDVCLMEQNEICSALCLIRSSPELEKIIIGMYDNEKLPVQQTPTNFLDPENHSDLNLDHLEILEVEKFSNLPLEMEFVKLIMAKSPVLKKVQIWLNRAVSVDEELKILRDLVRLPLPRASPSAELIIKPP